MNASPRKNISPTPSQPSPNEISHSHRPARLRGDGGDGEAHALSVDFPASDGALLLARCEIAEAYYHGGDRLALAVLAASSLRLYGSVVAGNLSADDLLNDLQECATNLGIAARVQDQVQAAISFGPRRYAEAA